MANSVDPDQMPQSVASDLGLHYLQRPTRLPILRVITVVVIFFFFIIFDVLQQNMLLVLFRITSLRELQWVTTTYSLNNRKFKMIIFVNAPHFGSQCPLLKHAYTILTPLNPTFI